jgi:hypothetical protein
MGAIQVKQVPDDVHAAARERAAAQGRSLGEYVLELIRRDLAAPAADVWWDDITGGPALVGPGFDGARAVADARAEHEAAAAVRDSSA